MVSLVESKLLQSKQFIFCSVPWKLRTCTKRFQCLCAVVLPFWTRVAKPRGNGSNIRTSDFAKRNRVSVQKTSMPALRKILKMIFLSYSVYRWFYVSELAPNAATGYFFQHSDCQACLYFLNISDSEPCSFAISGQFSHIN